MSPTRESDEHPTRGFIMSADMVLCETASLDERLFVGHPSIAVRQAYRMAQDRYNMLRLPNGESYLSHAERVAAIVLASEGTDLATAGALLHKLDFRLTKKPPREGREGVTDEQWSRIRGSVNRLEEITQRPFIEFGGRYAVQNYQDMIVNMCDTPDTMMLLLADKLASTTAVMPEEMDGMFQEMRLVWAPLSERLGLYELADGFRDQVFRLGQPGDYRRTLTDVGRMLQEKFGLERDAGESDEDYYGRLMSQSRTFLNYISSGLERRLEEEGIGGRVRFRIKSPYSIWKKLNYTDYETVEGLPDVFGIEVIYERPEDCQRILEVINGLNDPGTRPKYEYKGPHDPKAYGCEAYHVDCRIEGIPVEFQVLSRENYMLRETKRSHWQRDLSKREMPGQQFDEPGEPLTGDFEHDFARIRQRLQQSLYVIYLEGHGRDSVMHPLRLKRGSIPADLAALSTIDGLNPRYKGVSKLDLRAGVGITTAKMVTMSENYRLCDGDVLTLNPESHRTTPRLESRLVVGEILTNAAEPRTRQIIEGIIERQRR